MQMDFDPTGGAGDILPVILCSPAFDKAHSNGAHFSQLIDNFESLVHRLSEQLSKELVVENLQAAASGYLANGGWVKTMLIVAVAALNKNTAVTHTLRINLPSNIIQMNAFSNVPPGILYRRVSVYV